MGDSQTAISDAGRRSDEALEGRALTEASQGPRPFHLSPTRASDFKRCPQLFKFRYVDRLPEEPDPAAARGSLVHEVLEKLFRLPAAGRTRPAAQALLHGAVGAADAGGDALRVAGCLLDNYFRLEDPAERDVIKLEWRVELISSGAQLVGVIDRIDVDQGDWVLTDYKTGRAPGGWFAWERFLAMRFYALVCHRVHGRMPKQLRLLHLADPQIITISPTPQMLDGIDRQLHAVGMAIGRAYRSGDFRPRPGRICTWCPHRAVCPAWSGAGDFRVSGSRRAS